MTAAATTKVGITIGTQVFEADATIATTTATAAETTAVAAALQAEVADFGTGRQRLRTRHFELALDVVVGDIGV